MSRLQKQRISYLVVYIFFFKKWDNVLTSNNSGVIFTLSAFVLESLPCCSAGDSSWELRNCLFSYTLPSGVALSAWLHISPPLAQLGTVAGDRRVSEVGWFSRRLKSPTWPTSVVLDLILEVSIISVKGNIITKWKDPWWEISARNGK